MFDQIGRKALKGVNFDFSSGSKGGTLWEDKDISKGQKERFEVISEGWEERK